MLQIPRNGEGAPRGPLKSIPRSRLDWRRAGDWGSHPPRGAVVVNPRKKPSNWQSDQSALMLQRRRERLEIRALEARRPLAEQVADRRLQEVGL